MADGQGIGWGIGRGIGPDHSFLLSILNGDCRYGSLTGCGTWQGQIVPRLAILGEWDGRGEACWKWIVLLGLNLPFFMGFYALLQRTGIFAYWAVICL